MLMSQTFLNPTVEVSTNLTPQNLHLNFFSLCLSFNVLHNLRCILFFLNL